MSNIFEEGYVTLTLYQALQRSGLFPNSENITLNDLKKVDYDNLIKIKRIGKESKETLNNLLNHQPIKKYSKKQKNKEILDSLKDSGHILIRDFCQNPQLIKILYNNGIFTFTQLISAWPLINFFSEKQQILIIEFMGKMKINFDMELPNHLKGNEQVLNDYAETHMMEKEKYLSLSLEKGQKLLEEKNIELRKLQNELNNKLKEIENIENSLSEYQDKIKTYI